MHGSFTAVSAKAPTLLWDDAQLVVARYDEDVRWLDALPGNPMDSNKRITFGFLSCCWVWQSRLVFDV